MGPREHDSGVKFEVVAPAPARHGSCWMENMERTIRKYAHGTRIGGKYQLVRPLGEGGMGTVWVAYHVDLDTQVALKLVRGDIVAPEAGARLIREAKAAARLDHPAIVRVLDVGMHEGDAYLVMELLDGDSLADAVEREGRIHVEDAVCLVLPIISAVDTIHRAGMLHRDIKPENVLLARDGAGRLQPKLIDFGLAKWSAGTGESKITSHGAIIGTPAYLSPERLLGADAAPQDDLWALCVMLYGVIVGALPFDDRTGMDGLVAALLRPPRPLSEWGLDEPDLGVILERGLGPRKGRFESARALGKAIAAWAWRRGVTHDITGTSLRGTWLDDDDLRRLASGPGSSRVPTRRFAWTPPPASPSRAVEHFDDRTLSAPVVISTRAHSTRTVPAPLLIGLPLLAFGLVAGSLLVVRSGELMRPVAPSFAPEPLVHSVAVTATPAPTGAPEPTASPRPSAEPPPRVARSAAPPRAPPASPSARIELKNPYR